MTTDFYVPGAPSLDQNQSLLSQDFAYLNDNLATRPGAKAGKKGQKDMRGLPDGNQLRKVYGNINEISGLEQKKKRQNLSPHQASSGARPESSQSRLASGEPRLRGLESIYLNKFGKQGSQKNIGLKKPL